ncbi:chromate resistance protein ChrB domain-containing protein [Pararhizobium haloflavum]|uniref:chromate resistance protein ChrB domain-containing protein n=1 Tax=Pararhizobium haloflavum TaxID=2037914 RepID=UPI000C187426|nr:sulfurtransferase/chromate resistance protein [Pararhizobium haloflavum]
MSSTKAISVDKLARLVGTPKCPTLIDLRTEADFEEDQRLIPSARRRNADCLKDWIGSVNGPSIVYCQQGHKLSEGIGALLRANGLPAEILEGGFEAWRDAHQPLIPVDKLATTKSDGRTIWVTRARPKIDRIACPWLIRRFVDPNAIFLFVTPSEVLAVAERFGGAPFDIEGVFWSHRGDLCTFDVMVEEFGLSIKPLLHLATIVRGADTSRPDIAPEAPGLLAASLGLSRMFADDLDQLDAGMLLYDAFYRWCRDATGETHNWPHTRPGV